MEGVYRKHGSCENSVNHKSVIEKKLEWSRDMVCDNAKTTDLKKLLSHHNYWILLGKPNDSECVKLACLCPEKLGLR